MGNVVKGMDVAMKQMDLEKVYIPSLESTCSGETMCSQTLRSPQ